MWETLRHLNRHSKSTCSSRESNGRQSSITWEASRDAECWRRKARHRVRPDEGQPGWTTELVAPHQWNPAAWAVGIAETPKQPFLKKLCITSTVDDSTGRRFLRQPPFGLQDMIFRLIIYRQHHSTVQTATMPQRYHRRRKANPDFRYLMSCSWQETPHSNCASRSRERCLHYTAHKWVY